MGKSKRIRAERARSIASNPEKYASSAKNNGSKKSKIATIVIIALVAALLLGAIAGTIIVNTGSVLRWQNALSSENYHITGAMYAYMFYNTYNTYYNYFGSSVSSLLSYIQSNTKSQAQQILALCEGAKAAGLSLTDEDYKTIDDNIKTLENNLRAAGSSISGYFGNLGVTAADVREVMVLSTLADKFQTQKTEEFKNLIKDDEAKILEYIANNKANFYKADYITYTTSDKATSESLAAITDAKEFKAKLIEILVDSNYVTELTSATSSFELSEKPVESLNAAIKATIVAELKYKVLEIEPAEGLATELATKSDRLARIKLIFEELYGDTTFTAGENDTDKTGSATAITDKLYTAASTVAGKIETNITTAFKTAVKEGVAYNLKDVADSDTQAPGSSEAAPESSATPDSSTATTGEIEQTASETTTTGNTDTEKWIFADGRKTGDTTVLTVTEDNKTSYTVLICTKAMYLDESATKNVGHLLVKVETETAASDADQATKDKIKAENEKKFEEAKPTAQGYLDQFLATGKTKDDFEKIAKEHTDDSSVFYDNVRDGDMVDKFNDWIFAPERKAGDNGLIETEYGWHVMYFVGEGYPVWKDDAINSWVDDQWADWLEAETAKLNVNSKLIGEVDGGSDKVANS